MTVVSSLSRARHCAAIVLVFWGAAALPAQEVHVAPPPAAVEKVEVNEANVRARLLERVAEVGAAAPASGDAPSTISWPWIGSEPLALEVEEASVFSPVDQARYPALRNYRVRDVGGRFVGRLAVGPSGMRLVGRAHHMGAVAFEPEGHRSAHAGSGARARVYRLRRLDSTIEAGACGALDLASDALATDAGAPVGAPLHTTGETMRVYRLALACTGEFAAEAGGTLAAVNARYNEHLAEVNALYERDLAVSFRLAEGNDALIQLDAGTDAYPAPADPRVALDQTVDFIAETLPDEAYDLGHALHYEAQISGVGGIAYTTGVCNERLRGGGYSRVNPDQFRIFLHELGHQLGGRHTPYGCNSSGPYRYEPGAGATIMATDAGCSFADRGYLFIDGVGFEDYVAAFHARTIADMEAHISGDGDCFDAEATGNAAPVADARPGARPLAIPARTPFLLRGAATDADGDALTYSWESGDSDEDNSAVPTESSGIATAPLFRTLEPASSPDRYLPSLANLAGPPDDSRSGEILPTVARQMRMLLTVRDGRGGVDVDDTTLDVVDTGHPFAVTAPAAGDTWFVEEGTATVTWDVAGTDGGAIGCEAVDILLSVDGGLTFATVLAEGVPNSGSAEVHVPALTTGRARVMVRAAEHAFFNVTRESFAIAEERSCVTRAIEFVSGAVVRAPAGDERLRLGLAPAGGVSLGGRIELTIGNGSPQGDLWVSLNGGQCEPLNFGIPNSVRTESRRFTVEEDVTVTFELAAITEGNVGAASQVLYEADGEPYTCEGFLNSTSNHSTGADGRTEYDFAPFSQRLEAGREYALYVQSFSQEAGSGTVAMEHTPAGALVSLTESAAPGYVYTYAVAREVAAGIFLTVGFDEGADLSDAARFPAGEYDVIGVHAPADSDFEAAVGQDLNILTERVRCATLSEARQRVVIGGASSTSGPSGEHAIIVYPNPSSRGEVHVRLPSVADAEEATAYVTDALGRVTVAAAALTREGDAYVATVRLPDAVGMYVISVVGADGRARGRARVARE